MNRHGPRARPGFRRINRATRWTGTLLCWSHAAALLGTAAEAFLRPAADWWFLLWPTPWILTGALLAAWAVLRLWQRSLLEQTLPAAHPENDEPGDPGDADEPGDPDDRDADGERATYGQAA